MIVMCMMMQVPLFAQISTFPSREGFLKRAQFLIDKGGTWEAVNPSHKSDEEFSPVSFVYKFEAGYTPEAMKLKDQRQDRRQALFVRGRLLY
jgi:hypothetical protein